MLSPLGNGPGSRILRAVGTALSRGGPRGKLSILYYHRVHATADPLRVDDVDAEMFDWQMQVLARCFTVLPLQEAVTRLKAADLPPNAVCVTFDDGYADNVEVALPILERWQIPATFFLTTDYFEGGRMWNDTVIEALRQVSGPRLDLTPMGLGEYDMATDGQRRLAVDSVLKGLKYLPMKQRDEEVSRLLDVLGVEVTDRPMMSLEQLAALAQSGMEIGGHTACHPILSQISPQEAEREIVAGKRRLEEMIGREVHLFAYPNGVPNEDYDGRHVELVRNAGFEAAVSTAWGAASPGADLFQLPRIAPWDRTPLRFCLRILQGFVGNGFARA